MVKASHSLHFAFLNSYRHWEQQPWHVLLYQQQRARQTLPYLLSQQYGLMHSRAMHAPVLNCM
jgi:hypothetical protein